MKKPNILLPLVLSLGIGISSFYCSPKTTIDKLQVYNQQTREFIKRKGGLHEKLLDSTKSIFLKEYSTRKENLETYEYIEYLEKNTKFELKKDALEGFYSVFYTEQTLKMNRSIISQKRENITNKNLQDLLLKTDAISKNVQNDTEKIVKIYNTLSENFVNRNPTYGSLTITEILEKKDGADCNDYCPAVCAVLEHYGIHCWLVYGSVKPQNRERTLHVWLRLQSEGHTFDLDPTFYGVFIPLEPRG